MQNNFISIESISKNTSAKQFLHSNILNNHGNSTHELQLILQQFKLTDIQIEFCYFRMNEISFEMCFALKVILKKNGKIDENN